jgi:DNA polymerase-3 subunit gamma/tau
MSYLVLARKYRPRTFDDVVGQPHVIRPLMNALKSGRVAHAYLFSGARGVGKTTVARLLAMALSCESPEPERPCGECANCMEIIEGHAVDVFEVDGASNRGINEIRDLRETIKYLPTKGRFKVYIIDEVHMLTKEAFNALLKTLEEPPEHVVFIFATTEAHKVLPTILSRCQRYDFKRISLDDIVGRMEEIAEKESITVSPTTLRLLARESEGGMRDALSLFDQVIAYSGLEVKDEDIKDALGLVDQAMISDLARALLGGDAGAALDLLDQAYGFGYDTKDFAAQVLSYLRALVVVKVSRNPENILDLMDAEIEALKAVAESASLPTLNFYFNEWLNAVGRLSRATTPRLILEALIVRLSQVEPLTPLAELTARLEALLAANPVAGGSVPSGSAPGGPVTSTPTIPRTPPTTPPSTPKAAPAESSPSPTPPAAYPADPPVEEQTTKVSEPTPVPKPVESPSETQVNGPKDWATYLQEVETKRPMIHAVLAPAKVERFDGEEVSLILGHKNGSWLDEDIKNSLFEFFGRRPKLQVKVDATVTPDKPAAKAAVDPNQKEIIKKEILDNPLVKEAGEILNGEFVDFIPER